MDAAATDRPVDGGPRLSAHLSMLFREVAFERRPAAAAAAGLDAVECWWPFTDARPGDREVARVVAAVRDAGVQLVALNLDGGDLGAGDRGLLSDPDHTARFRDNLEVALAIAAELRCPVLNALYGNRRPGLDPREQDELAVEHLGVAAAAARRIGATVVVEALNPWENPWYPLRRATEVLALADRVERVTGERIRCLYDLYHAQRTEGELRGTIRRHADRFGHVQVADAPGRGEPGTGEIDVPNVLRELAASGYTGAVGLEYTPTSTTRESLRSLPSWRGALRGDPT